jgi:hypothetical protein
MTTDETMPNLQDIPACQTKIVSLVTDWGTYNRLDSIWLQETSDVTGFVSC